MSFLSKLFGNEQELKDTAKGILNGILNEVKTNSAQQSKTASAGTERTQKRNSPCGESWGEVMPDEENQYNYGGSFWQYFENIFHSEFSHLRFERNELTPFKHIVYNFFSGEAKVLTVELLSESSSVQKIRNECRRENTAYLRFYIDHDGWWNTRSYVVKRMRNALNG